MATKKSTKKLIEPPIDQRETFMSLSKNMGDTDAVTMEHKLHTLYKLQQTDTKIDRIHLLRGELPLEVQDLEDEIAGLETRISNAQSEIQSMTQAISEFKHKIAESEKAIAKYEEQRNNVMNNREYESLSKEIEFQTLDKQLSEKKIREGEIFIGEKKALVDETHVLLDGRSADLAEKKMELETIIRETAVEEEELLSFREKLVSDIDERTMAAYEKMRSSAHNRLAVVTVKRDACGGCFNKIPPQRQLDISMSKKIIVCDYCGRIIVSSDFETEEA